MLWLWIIIYFCINTYNFYCHEYLFISNTLINLSNKLNFNFKFLVAFFHETQLILIQRNLIMNNEDLVIYYKGIGGSGPCCKLPVLHGFLSPAVWIEPYLMVMRVAGTISCARPLPQLLNCTVNFVLTYRFSANYLKLWLYSREYWFLNSFYLTGNLICNFYSLGPLTSNFLIRR